MAAIMAGGINSAYKDCCVEGEDYVHFFFKSFA
jgi:hypothetical protein